MPLPPVQSPLHPMPTMPTKAPKQPVYKPPRKPGI